MLQMRYDHSQPGGGKEIGVHIETTDGNTPIEQIYETAQKVVRRLEGQEYNIEGPDENEEETEKE
ncbi:hypothetical protein KBB89_03030 [Candidatus Gracilibacteria bacterium]|nr:hypothetical protein [Candidatus Gracilibacteria bacterium]